ncbi:MAG: Dyp-type peroxidase [Propioniciclava sp.]
MTRRGVLIGGATAAAGAAAMVGVERVLGAHEATIRAETLQQAGHLNGQQTIAFHGSHQAGVEMHPQAHQTLVALRLHPDSTRDALRRLLTLLTDDAVRLTRGASALADTEPELALLPARLTVTFGFGRRLVEIVHPGQSPAWLADLPAFSRDRLSPQWSGGDLLLQFAADDPLTVAHAQRMMLKDSRNFASVAWVQPGFRRAYGSEPAGQTQRNLFGQLDGTVNMALGSEDFADVVWRGPEPGPAWLVGGTGFVVRRIAMNLDTWDRLDRSGREQALGRRMASGAPLTGTGEHDEPDFTALTPVGFPTIPEFSHLRRARSDDPHERMFRRTYNYDVPPSGDAVSEPGLIFTAFQHNVATQFTPVQRRLDELDLLNEWITHIGSAVFAIPPGCGEGEFIGQTLFDA